MNFNDERGKELTKLKDQIQSGLGMDASDVSVRAQDGEIVVKLYFVSIANAAFALAEEGI